MPALVDTTIRLLSQEPLAGRLPAGAIFEVAELLDGAGFACLEVSGGGVFDSAVRRGVESPWERIRALEARTKTPLGLALRGRFLVGSRPVGPDFVRRFVASAAENGIQIFRLHDPLNDVSNLREASEAIADAGGEFDAGLVYGSGLTGQTDVLVEQARKLPELGAARVLLHDPSGSLQPHRAHELVRSIREQTGLPVGLYCQGAGGNALAATLEAVRAGADRIACAVYPVALTLHRVSGEGLADALSGLEFDAGVDVAALWRASEVIDEHIGDEPVTPLAPRVAVRAAEHNLPAGLVAALDAQLRAQGAGGRIDEVLAELATIRAETGWPPLAAPIGQILASQALVHVLSAARYQVVVDELRGLITEGQERGFLTFAQIEALSVRLGKTPVTSSDAPGFIGNRILIPFLNEAITALQQGVGSARDIDQVAKLGFHHPIGPLELADFIGLDVVLGICRVMYDGLHDPRYAPNPLLERLVEAGQLGRKTGRGFHVYNSP